MLNQQSTTTPTPATTTGQPALSDLLESAREKTRIAARIAGELDSLRDVNFSDLELIARNCYAANRSLETVIRALADADRIGAEASEAETSEAEASHSAAALMVSSL